MVGLLLPLCLAASAGAGTGDDVADATKLLRSSRDEAALQLITRALDRDTVAAPQRAELYVLLGIARFNLRDEEGAKLAFKRAVEANLEVVPKLVPPRARGLFEQMRAQVERTRNEAPPPAPTPEPVAAAAPAAPCPVERPVVQAAAPEVTAAPPEPMVRRYVGLGLLAVGAAAVGTGAFLMGNAAGQRAAAVATPDALGADRTYLSAVGTHWAGFGVLCGGAAVAIVGLIVAVWPSSSPSSVALAFSSNSVWVSGRF
jgi:hypothetical protein